MKNLLFFILLSPIIMKGQAWKAEYDTCIYLVQNPEITDVDSNNYFFVQKDGYWGLVKDSGVILVEPIYDYPVNIVHDEGEAWEAYYYHGGYYGEEETDTFIYNELTIGDEIAFHLNDRVELFNRLGEKLSPEETMWVDYSFSSPYADNVIVCYDYFGHYSLVKRDGTLFMGRSFPMIPVAVGERTYVFLENDSLKFIQTNGEEFIPDSNFIDKCLTRVEIIEGETEQATLLIGYHLFGTTTIRDYEIATWKAQLSGEIVERSYEDYEEGYEEDICEIAPIIDQLNQVYQEGYEPYYWRPYGMYDSWTETYYSSWEVKSGLYVLEVNTVTEGRYGTYDTDYFYYTQSDSGYIAWETGDFFKEGIELDTLYTMILADSNLRRCPDWVLASDSMLLSEDNEWDIDGGADFNELKEAEGLSYYTLYYTDYGLVVFYGTHYDRMLLYSAFFPYHEIKDMLQKDTPIWDIAKKSKKLWKQKQKELED